MNDFPFEAIVAAFQGADPDRLADLGHPSKWSFAGGSVGL
jgi:hypothetical protein